LAADLVASNFFRDAEGAHVAIEETHPIVRSILAELNGNGGLLVDLWFDYQGERWHPVLVRDRASGKVGFEVNISGRWGPNAEVGRRKFSLVELLLAIQSGTIPPDASIRSKCQSSPQRNGRRFRDVRMSARLIEALRG
jgi:hypothetical protein